MLPNCNELFIDNIFLYITGENGEQKDKGAIIKRHSERLNNYGEFSFPKSLKSWNRFFKDPIQSKDSDLLQFIGKTIEDFIIESNYWNFQISKITFDADRYYIYINKINATESYFLNNDRYCTWVLNKIQEYSSNVICHSSNEQANDMTSLRLKYLKKAIANLYSVSLLSNIDKSTIFLSNKSTSKGPEGSLFVYCGSILNAKYGLKETSISSEDYISMRQNEMTLIAQHKYGVRVSSDLKWKEFLSHLGNSAAVFELLQIKPSSSIKINFDCPSVGSSKGAAFVLYNCARLESILRSYNEKVAEGVYPSLPNAKDVDFQLLTHEDEWLLMFNFILAFPSLISSCVTIEENKSEFRPHHICSFLSSMVRVFSQYYRKVRILTEPRKHLLPVMFARLHLLQSLNEVLKTCLTIINIKSVTQM